MFPADCRTAVTGFVLAFLLQMSPMHLSFNSFLSLICIVGMIVASVVDKRVNMERIQGCSGPSKESVILGSC